MGYRVVFTGGSGKAGVYVVQHLVAKGHDVLNLDLRPTSVAGVPSLATDLMDEGQVFNALTMHFRSEEYRSGRLPAPPDAVVHFAASVVVHPDNKTFEVNAISTYNVIETAVKIGVRKVIIASSETVYGVCLAEGDKDYKSFPLDEDYDVDPTDTYGLSKVVNEKTARALAMRYGVDVYALRVGNVIEPHGYDRFSQMLANPASRKRHAWSYVDARDLGEIVHRCLLVDGLGFQIFNATNDSITAAAPTAEFLAQHAPKTPFIRSMGEWEAPISNRKAREVLGFTQQYDWRKLVGRD